MQYATKHFKRVVRPSKHTDSPMNKKVILRERKIYTARRVASTRYTFPVGGTPPPRPGQVGGEGKVTPISGRDWGGGTPSQVIIGGTPCLCQDGGYPHLANRGSGTPSQVRMRVSPHQGPRSGWRVLSPRPDLGRGYPLPSAGWACPPSRGCGRTDACENITFPLLWMQAVKNCIQPCQMLYPMPVIGILLVTHQ